MIKKGWTAAMLGAAALAMSGSALAQQRAAETGWYAGASLGSNDDFDDGMAWKFSAGYQINRNLSAEFGYTALGDTTVLGVKSEASAWELIGVYKYPLQNRIWIYGLAGFARVEVETSGSFFGLPVSSSDTSTELTFGFGVQYDLSQKLAARAQYQDYDGGSVISVGVVYKF